MTTLQRATTSRPYQAGDITGMKLSRAAAKQAAKEQAEAERNALIDRIPGILEFLLAENREMRREIAAWWEHTHGDDEQSDSAA